MILSSERPMDAWACLRQAHASCVCFAGEFRKFGALARTDLFWRRRFGIQCNFCICFVRKYKKNFYLKVFFDILEMLNPIISKVAEMAILAF